MGNVGTTTRKSHGTLIGGYAPPLPGVQLESLAPTPRVFKVNVREFGGFIEVAIDGVKKVVKVPKANELSAEERKGFFFYHKVYPDISKTMIASTLHQVPGMEIVVAKPVVWGSVSHTFYASSTDQQSMGSLVSSLLQDSQLEIMQQAAEVGCNAVLGLNFTVTNDSSGEHGNYKAVIVTATGTPCMVMPAAVTPAVRAEVMVLPMDNYSASC